MDNLAGGRDMPFTTKRSVLMSEDLSRNDGSSTHVIAVSSGKGGVGKTNVVANLAVALTRAGKRVLILDADLGLGNLDVLLGLVPRHTIETCWWARTRSTRSCSKARRTFRCFPPVPVSHRRHWSQQLIIQAAGAAHPEMDVLLIEPARYLAERHLLFAARRMETG